MTHLDPDRTKAHPKPTKLWNQAPLPFTGQKRYFLEDYRQLLDQIPGDGEGWTIIDVFGGSGLLSNNAKFLKPAARVIYNDYDGYTHRLNHIADTNLLRQQLEDILADVPRQARLNAEQTHAVTAAIKDFDGFVDAHTLSAFLLFSGNFAASLDDLFSKTFYSRIRRSDYELADGYLDGVEVVNESYDTLMPQFVADKKALFVLDPPYVNTSQQMYKLDAYFGMCDFLRLMRYVRPPFLFFSSEKSELESYLDFIKEHRPDDHKILGQYNIARRTNPLNNRSTYEDQLVSSIPAYHSSPLSLA